jgi:hypothetical protein
MMNPQLTPAQVGVLEQALGTDGNASKATTTDSAEPEGPSQYEIEHAAEIAAEEGKPFALYSGGADQESTEQSETEGSESASDGSIEPERVSVFQKIAKLSVGERVQLAMRGTKDERFILVRDGARVVAQAVLESPKVSEQEIETFAALKNVQEGVLRGIAGKRKFMKNYAVVRNLTSNPRCPVDVSLPLLTHLLVKDLRNLSVNKNVADTIRKMAFKLWKQKTESNKR